MTTITLAYKNNKVLVQDLIKAEPNNQVSAFFGFREIGTGDNTPKYRSLVRNLSCKQAKENGYKIKTINVKHVT